MTKEEKERVKEDIANEGFHRTFGTYEFHEWIEDPEFQELKEAYMQSVEDLIEYIK